MALAKAVNSNIPYILTSTNILKFIWIVDEKWLDFCPHTVFKEKK